MIQFEEEYRGLFREVKHSFEYASDVVVYWELTGGRVYQNLATGERSHNKYDVLREGKRTLYIKKQQKPLNGYYVRYDEERDVIVIETAVLSLTGLKPGVPVHWECYGYRSGFVIKRNGDTYVNAGRSGAELNTMIDICGECNRDYGDQIDYIYCIHTSRLLRDFFGCDYYTYSNLASIMFADKDGLPNFVSENVPKEPEKKKRVLDKLLSYKLPEVVLTDEMSEVFMNEISIRNNNELNYSMFKEDPVDYFIYLRYCSCKDFMVVDRAVVDGNAIAVIRFITIYVKPEYLVDGQFITRESLGIFEYARTYVTGDETWSCRSIAGKYVYTRKSGKIGNYQGILVPWDDETTKGTKLEFLGRISEEAKDYWNRMLNFEPNHKASYASRQLAENFHAMLETPLFEAFLSSGLTNFIWYANAYCKYSTTPVSILESLFGAINKKEKKLYKAIGVCPSIVRWMDEKLDVLDKSSTSYNQKYLEYPYIYGIKVVKTMFASCPEYLQDMSLDTFKRFYQSIADSAANEMLVYHGAVEIITYIIMMNGPRNIYEYADYVPDFLCKLSVCDDEFRKFYYNERVNMYKDYLKAAVALKDAGIMVKKWKFRDMTELRKAHDDIVEIYNNLCDEIKEKEFLAKAEKLKKRWEKLEYNEDQFIVVMPNDMSDIVNEGFELSHCVKTYINDVITEKTIIMFIRRTAEPDKPFYTLEIRDKVVRQCHGFANCNINKEPGLEDFLKRYCAAVNIRYNDGHRCLVANR